MKFVNKKTGNFLDIVVPELVELMVRSDEYFAFKDADFKESDHPRDKDGKFGSGGGGGSASISEPSKSTKSSDIPKSMTSSQKEKWKAKYKQNEDLNDHGANALMEAKLVGSEEDIKAIKEINKRHEDRGHLSEEDNKKRYEIGEKLAPKVKEVLSESNLSSKSTNKLTLKAESVRDEIKSAGIKARIRVAPGGGQVQVITPSYETKFKESELRTILKTMEKNGFTNAQGIPIDVERQSQMIGLEQFNFYPK